MSVPPPIGAGKVANPAPPISPEIAPLDVVPVVDDADTEDLVVEEPAEEAASAPLLRDPGEPTQEEVDQHNLTHAAFRS